MEIINTLFGHGKDLNALQMGVRAIIMFFITLLMIRTSGMRAFGNKSAFDNIVVIMLGALLSRGVTGASPFIPIVTAGFVMCAVHRLLAYLAIYNKVISHIIKTNDLCLYKDGVLNKNNMERCDLSMGDLMSGVRHNANVASLEEVEQVYMERTGEISVVKKKG